MRRFVIVALGLLVMAVAWWQATAASAELITADSYTMTPEPRPEYPDPNHTMLTDGIIVSGAWDECVGWNNKTGASPEPMDPPLIEFSFDQKYDFTKIEVGVYHRSLSGIHVPVSIVVEGVTYEIAAKIIA